MKKLKFQKRLFGTNGVRGVVGKDMTPDFVQTIGRALGSMRQGCIAVGRDTRTSGDALITAVKTGIISTGCDVVDCGILPTPALQYIVKDQFDGGAMITASHNPPEYNGVKIIEPDGTEMGDEETIKLEHLIFEKNNSTVAWSAVGKERSSPYLIEQYIKSIVNHFPKKNRSKITVVVDPGSGPACLTTARILTEMGCRVLTVNGIIDGSFPGRLPEPTPEGLSSLSELVKMSGAAFGLAHDGDADRTVFVDENGQYIEENVEFALIAKHMCKRREGVIVTPVSTSQLVETVANSEGCSVVYTPVGSIYVARTMRLLLENGVKVIFGGEGNGGLIFPEHQFCRDGGMTAAMMVSIIDSEEKSISSVLKDLPVRHMIKEKISSQNCEQLLESFRSAFANETLDQTDGLKIIRKDCWALVRTSGTEPLIRIIIDGATVEKCRALRDELMTHIPKLS
jgi:phosphomannomutase / phosphoglucomutase